MIVCSLHADIVYKPLSSNPVTGLQDIVDSPHRVFHIANTSPSRSITRAEGKALVLSCAAICPYIVLYINDCLKGSASIYQI